ncbi:GlxA family transcriptional regulator [Alteromonas oceanisediminis]|uniref:GlxA family transcriptional regulator n=1 Tax=Alteromonas oceanisediminis TaxID=2836180 RepID=UPI001BDA8B76|nr:helix-turn-helix domain-containing protein [Alteromonas oceanisediminis]MBT0586394.1 helix-turn-helix domain-containing protein [Alteromonas oceanisediminis]
MDSLNHTKNSRFRVIIVGFDQALASSITGAIDMFSLAGVAWQRIHNQAVQRHFEVRLASLNGQDVHCINGNTLKPHCRLDHVESASIVLVPTIGGDISYVLEQTRGLLPELIRLHRAGSDIASNCTGAFILANSGLLDHKLATTHWGYAERFGQQFPQVNLQPNQLITEDERIFCAGGGMAWYDLVLRLIERYCGHHVASETAKSHVIDAARGHQAAYAPLQRRKFHHDAEILALQNYLEQHLAEATSVEHMAQLTALSTRTLMRRFKRATGKTPQLYVQELRVEQAKRLLDSTPMPIAAIVQSVGYEDLSSFNRLFKRITGLSPGFYRKSLRN